MLSSAARALLSNELSECCARLEGDGTYPPMTRTSTKLLRDALKKVVDAGAAFLPPVEQHVAPQLYETPPVAPARRDDGRFNKEAVIDGEQEVAPRPPVADGETPIAVPLVMGRSCAW